MTETPIPTPPPPETPTPTIPPPETPAAEPTPSETPVEVTAEPTPETTPETTLEVTPEATDLVTETPTATSTASATPLPPEPAWVLVSRGDFEQGMPPTGWLFDNAWGPQIADGNRAFGPRSFGGSALFVQTVLHDSAVQLRLRLGNGIASFGLRQSEAGGYTATFEESGYLRLYRNEQEVGQMFLGPVAGQWRTLRLSAAGDVVRVFLDGAELIMFVDDAPLPAGFVTLGGTRSIGSRFLIDDLSVWAAEGEATRQPAALAAPMAFGAMGEGVAGRIETALAYYIIRPYPQYFDGYMGNFLRILQTDGIVTAFDDVPRWMASKAPWSPDGQRLLVRTHGSDGFSVFDPATVSTLPLTTLPQMWDGSGDDCPVWSPDGTRIAFLSSRRDGQWASEWGHTYPRTAIYVVNADGQSEPIRAALAEDGAIFDCPIWRTETAGESILFTSTDWYTGAGSVRAMDVSNGAGPVSTLFSRAGSFTNPHFSPDGTKLAFTEQVDCGCTQQVRVLDLANGNVIEVTNDPEVTYFWNVPEWSPDSLRLVVEGYLAFSGEYTLVIADITQPCPACGGLVLPVHLAQPVWSSDGQWLAGFGSDGLALLAADGSELISVPGSGLDGATTLAAWQPLDCIPANPNAPLAFSAGGEYCVPVTPTPEPTPMPRMVETQAQPFHNHSLQFGLPAPFTLWPVTEPDLFQNGYGPNWFVYSGNEGACLTPPAPISTIAPEPTAGPPPTSIPDRCQYRYTNGIHTGMDWFNQTEELMNQIAPSDVVALCDGIIVPGRTPTTATGGGGSVSPNAGFGLSLRCFANDPNDTDADGLRNLSNIVVVYNHLTLATGISPAQSGGPYQIVRAGDVIAQTIGYMTSSGYVQPHLHLELYLAYGYQTTLWAIQINPRLMFASPMAHSEREQAPYPEIYPEGVWTLQGLRLGSGSTISFLDSPSHPAFIYDAAEYIEDNLLPVQSPYIYPNCTNMPANSDGYGMNSATTHCTLDRNDIAATPPPVP